MISLRKDAATGNKYKMYVNGREVREDLWGRHIDEAKKNYEGKILAAQQIIAGLNYEVAKLEAESADIKLDNETATAMLAISEARYKKLVNKIKQSNSR